MSKNLPYYLLSAFILCAAIYAGNAQAETQDYCTKVSGLAANIMEARQGGVPMSKALAAVGDSEMLRMMVIEAYEKPRYSTAAYKQRTIADFRDDWHLGCVKAMK